MRDSLRFLFKYSVLHQDFIHCFFTSIDNCLTASFFMYLLVEILLKTRAFSFPPLFIYLFLSVWINGLFYLMVSASLLHYLFWCTNFSNLTWRSPSCCLLFLFDTCRRLNLVPFMLKWRLSLAVLLPCTAPSSYRNNRLSIQSLQDSSISLEWVSVVSCGASRRLKCIQVGEKPVGCLLFGAPDRSFCRKVFLTKWSSNGFPNFWLLSKTGFLG